jgi:hypothetical protein
MNRSQWHLLIQMAALIVLLAALYLWNPARGGG